MRFMPMYLAGRQPCGKFVSYECYYGEETIDEPCHQSCNGTVSFCESCREYHHSGGWDTCGREPG